MQEIFIQLVALGAIVRLFDLASWQDSIKRLFTRLLLLLSLLLLGISIVRIGLNPIAVPGLVWLIGGSLFLLGVMLQLAILSGSDQSTSENFNLLENSLHWLRGTWAILSLVFVPLLLWSSFIQTRQTLGLLLGQGIAVLILGAIIVGTILLLEYLSNQPPAPGLGLAVLCVPIAGGGLLHDMVRFLLKRGADPNLIRYDRSPLRHTREQKYQDIEALLLEYGAKEN